MEVKRDLDYSRRGLIRVGSDILIRGPTQKLEVGGEGGKLIIGQFYFWRERGRYLLSDSEDIFIRENKGFASKNKKYLVQRSKE